MKNQKKITLLEASFRTQLFAISLIALMILTAIPITAGITKGTPQLSNTEPKTLNPEKITEEKATEKEVVSSSKIEEKPAEKQVIQPSKPLDTSKELLQPSSSEPARTFADMAKLLDKCDYAPGEILVKFKPGINVQTSETAIKASKQIASGDRSIAAVLSAEPVFSSTLFGKDTDKKSMDDLAQWVKISVNKNVDILAQVKYYQKSMLVEAVQPNYLVTAYMEPNDPYYHSNGSWGQSYPDMWGLHRIEMSRAWDVTTGNKSVVVAVLDTGVDYSLGELQKNMWRNQDEIPWNGIDDDHDGFVDNIYGADFVGSNAYEPKPDGDPIDDMGHGTHCAGTIAAVGNNNLGVVGVNWQAQIMAVKGLDRSGGGLTDTLADAFVWAVNQGANVISNSWGMGTRTPSNPIFETVVHYATAHGRIVVFAAGNSHDDVQYYSPQNMDEVIAVAAVDPYDQQASFTNWGEQVAVCAPGVNILSLRATYTDMYGDGSHTVGENYIRANGTSMACPHVAGLAALLLSQDPNLTPAMIKNILKETGDPVNSFRPIGLRINAADALNRVKAAVAQINLPDWADMKGTMMIQGTANGVLFESYTLEYGTGYNPNSWTQITSSTVPVTNGVLGSFDVSGLAEGTYTLHLNVFYDMGLVKTFSHLIVVNNIQNTYVVGETSGPGIDFTLIQDAVNASGKNDVVFVRSGVYQQLVKVDRPMHLLGENQDTTFIDGGHTAHIIITITANEVTIDGFTLRNTGPNTNWGGSLDAGIVVSGDKDLITGNRFFDASVGIGVSGGLETTIVDNVFQSRFGGCGIYFGVTSRNSIQNNIFYGPFTGIYAANSDHNVIRGNIFTGNNSDTDVGIIFFQGTCCNIVENNIIQNYGYGAFSGAGILCFFSAQNLIAGNRIEGNGDGIEIAFLADENTIVNNLFLKNLGYGVYIPPDLAGWLGGHNCLFYHNNFIDNGVNAYDPSYNNMWYNSTLEEGNYWSDLPFYHDDFPLEHPYPRGSADFYICAESSLYHGYVGDLISFTGSADDGISPYSWTWDLGDGTISNEQNPAHTYTQVGRYTITLTVTDHEGDTLSDTIYVWIGIPLIADTHGPYTESAGIPIQFTGSAIGGVAPYMWQWSFDDYTISSEQNPTHTFYGQWIYNISLTVVDALGTIATNTTTVTTIISAPPPPIIADAYGPYSGIVGLPIQFSGSATGGGPPYSCYWYFGDGTYSREQNAAHVYRTSGVYDVLFEVYDSVGSNSSYDLTNVTIECGIVSAYGPYTGSVDEEIHFTGSIFGGIGPYIWNWDFGDGNTTSYENIDNVTSITHTYTVGGEYGITLTVIDLFGNTANYTTAAFIPEAGSLIVDVRGPYTSIVGETIQFIGNVYGGVSPYTWYWDFGDGQTADEQNPCHTYSVIGNYTVTLIVTDNNGSSDSDSTLATINGLLQANANGPYYGNAGNFVYFVGSATGGYPPYNWFWDFGDGTNVSEYNPSHIYAHRGTYTVTLTVTDSHGASVVSTTTVNIMVEADVHGPYSGYVNVPIQFIGSVSGGAGPYIWFWDFGDENTTSYESIDDTTFVTYVYTGEGEYGITLTVIDLFGNITIATTVVSISELEPLIVNIEGPSSGYWYVPITFTGVVTGGVSPYTYSWNFGDNSLTIPGEFPTITHSYIFAGTFTIVLTITDSLGNTVESNHLTCVISQLLPESPTVAHCNAYNDHPNDMNKGIGRIRWSTPGGVLQTFTATSTQIIPGDIYYKFFFGDGTDSGWLGPYTSGQVATATHDFNNIGYFNVTAVAKVSKQTSDSSVPLTVRMYKLGDVNGDGRVTFADIDPFVEALNGKIAFYANRPNSYWYTADTNLNNDVTYADIDPFVALIGD